MSKFVYYIKLYIAYLKIAYLMAIEYPLDSFILLISIVLREVGSLISIFVISKYLGEILVWREEEIVLMFAFSMFVEAFGQMCCDSFWTLGGFIKKGKFDILKIRPCAIMFQLLSQRIYLPAAGSLVLSGYLIGNSLRKMKIELNVQLFMMIMLFLIGGIIINSSIYCIFNSLNFWLINATDIAVFVQMLREFSKYPLDIFPYFMKIVFSVVIPYGFVAYYPVAIILNKMDTRVLIYYPVIIMCIVGGAALIWKKGVKVYQSTGT